MRRDGASPLNPSGETAHQWLQRELAKPAYADQRSWLQRLWDWAIDRLDDLLQGVGGALPLYALIPLLLVVVALVAFGLTRLRARGASSAKPSRDGVLDDIDLSAEELRRRAGQQEAEGAHSAAYIDYFRAVTRRAEERALLLPQPGRTAHEVGVELTSYFPHRAAEIRAAATFFDQVRYGGADADAPDVTRIRELEHDLDGTRPQHEVPPARVTA